MLVYVLHYIWLMMLCSALSPSYISFIINHYVCDFCETNLNEKEIEKWRKSHDIVCLYLFDGKLICKCASNANRICIELTSQMPSIDSNKRVNDKTPEILSTTSNDSYGLQCIRSPPSSSFVENANEISIEFQLIDYVRCELCT